MDRWMGNKVFCGLVLTTETTLAFVVEIRTSFPSSREPTLAGTRVFQSGGGANLRLGGAATTASPAMPR